MDAETSEVILAKRSNSDPVQSSWEKIRELLAEQFPGSMVIDPILRIPRNAKTYKIITVYKSRNKQGQGRVCGPYDNWAVVLEFESNT